MNTLPVEIGKIDVKTYRSMLAIPKFARTVTIGYRLDIMMKAGFNHANFMSIPRNYYDGTVINSIRRKNTYTCEWGLMFGHVVIFVLLMQRYL